MAFENTSHVYALHEAWFWMNLLHLQQVSVVAHTTHNRLRPDLSPDLTSPPTYITQPQPIITPHYPTPTSFITILTETSTSSYSHPHPDIPSIHLSIIHTHPPIHKHLHAYTFNCKQIINFIYFY